MFAALTVARLRDATTAAGLDRIQSWLSPDEVAALDLPLATAAEKVVGSMHSILLKTKTARDEALVLAKEQARAAKDANEEKKRWLELRRVQVAEVRIVRNLEDVRHPDVAWRAEAF